MTKDMNDPVTAFQREKPQAESFLRTVGMIYPFAAAVWNGRRKEASVYPAGSFPLRNASDEDVMPVRAG